MLNSSNCNLDVHFVVRCQRSPKFSSPESPLFAQLVALIERCIRTAIDDQTGEPLSEEELDSRLNAKIHAFRKLAFTDYFTLLKEVVFTSTGELTNAAHLRKLLQLTSDTELLDIAAKLGVVTSRDLSESQELLRSRDFVTDLLIYRLTKPKVSSISSLNLLSLYPDEKILFDTNLIPENDLVTTERIAVYPLPKLNLQFLSLSDYLQRNFELYRLESAFAIRTDLLDAVSRMKPGTNRTIGADKPGAAGSGIVFEGWARMAVPLLKLSLTEVCKPHIGELIPSRTSCMVEVESGSLGASTIRLLIDIYRLMSHASVPMCEVSGRRSENTMVIVYLSLLEIANP